MLNDGARNESYRRAIRNVVSPHHRVVDIGAGTGVLSVTAARSGAFSVDAIEGDRDMASVAREVFAREDVPQVILHEAHSTALQYHSHERRNLLITEIFDCGVVGEGVIPVLRHARAHLLTEGYESIPRSVALDAALVSAPQVRQLNEVSNAFDIDVRALNAFQTQGHYPVRLDTWDKEFLSGPERMFVLDLREEPDDRPSFTVKFSVTTNGMVDGLAAWFDMDLDGIEHITNAPGVQSHWMQAFIPFGAPLQVRTGDALSVEIALSEETRLVATRTWQSPMTTAPVRHHSPANVH